MTSAGLAGAAANSGIPFNVSNNGEAYAFHPGGINVVFGDASTRFLDEGMGLQAFCSIVTRAGGEQTAAP